MFTTQNMLLNTHAVYIRSQHRPTDIFNLHTYRAKCHLCQPQRSTHSIESCRHI